MSPTSKRCQTRDAAGTDRPTGRPGDTIRRDNFYGGKDNIIITHGRNRFTIIINEW